MDQTKSLAVILLHDQMLNKHDEMITSALTLLDLHDIARTTRTYNLFAAYIAHSSISMRNLGRTLKAHWEDGFGSTYNPNRKLALESVKIVESLDQAIDDLQNETGKIPKLIATSAKSGGTQRISFSQAKQWIQSGGDMYLLMLGTGWGMSDELIKRANYFLEPIQGNSSYNHLSVRTACAIMIDRLVGD